MSSVQRPSWVSPKRGAQWGALEGDPWHSICLSLSLYRYVLILAYLAGEARAKCSFKPTGGINMPGAPADQPFR